MEEKSSMTYLELQSQNLTLPDFPQIVKYFSNFYEKKLFKCWCNKIKITEIYIFIRN